MSRKIVLLAVVAAWCAPLASQAEPTATRLVADPVFVGLSLDESGSVGLRERVGPMRATLTDADGLPLVERAIVFEVDANEGTGCTALTNDEGVAACGAATAGYSATFAGDDAHAPSTAEGCLVMVSGRFGACVSGKDTLVSAKLY